MRGQGAGAHADEAHRQVVATDRADTGGGRGHRWRASLSVLTVAVNLRRSGARGIFEIVGGEGGNNRSAPAGLDIRPTAKDDTMAAAPISRAVTRKVISITPASGPARGQPVVPELCARSLSRLGRSGLPRSTTSCAAEVPSSTPHRCTAVPPSSDSLGSLKQPHNASPRIHAGPAERVPRARMFDPGPQAGRRLRPT